MAQPLRALYPGETSPPPRPSLSPGSRPNRLWIAVHLPEVEDRELVSLACWMRRITPLVSLEPPQALVLEVGGSLRLWGGLDSIEEALDRELGRRRLSAHLCAAPTALAALWLARDGRKDVLSTKRLAGFLGALPLHVTGWPQATRRLLKKMGLGTVGDCLRLSRDGLVRRVGQRCLDDLDRSLGRQPDLRTAFRPDRRFSSVVEFQEEVTSPQVIAEAGKRLILRLAEALHGHQAQIASCRYGFRHLRRPATMVRISQVVPTHESRKIIDLFLTRLETLSLPAPVTALSLTTGKITPMAGLNAGLFPACPDRASETTLGELIARLQTRFSAEDIHGLGLAENHRPEAAWSEVRDPWAGFAAVGRGIPDHRGGIPAGRRPARQATAPGYPQRPLWLLPMPVSVTAADGEWGHLRLESGPERIEAGWWEGLDTSRDYYVARGSRGRRLWVFRDRRSGRGDWYLHGIFG